MEFNLSEKRKEIFKEHLDFPANCNIDCIIGIKKEIIEQDKEFIKLLKEEIQSKSLSDSIANTLMANDESEIRTISPLECDNIIDKLAGPKLNGINIIVNREGWS